MGAQGRLAKYSTGLHVNFGKELQLANCESPAAHPACPFCLVQVFVIRCAAP